MADDEFRRTHFVRELANFPAAFGVSDDSNARALLPRVFDVLRQKPLVHGAMTLPEDDAGPADVFFRQSSAFLVRVPDGHLLEGDAHAVSRIPPQVFIGDEQAFLAAPERPLHDF